MNRATPEGPKGTIVEKELLQEALRAFEDTIGTVAHVLKREPRFAEGVADAVLEVGDKKNKTDFVVEIKRNVAPTTIGHIVTQLRRFKKPGMLITRYVNPPMAERLRELDIAFMDTAGNAYINAPKFFVYVTGRKPPEADRITKPVKVFRPTGLQVLFTLLCKPELVKAPYRNIANTANVALGTVGWVMYDLKHLGYLLERGKHGRKLLNKRKLLDAWVTAYAQTLRPKLHIGRFRAPGRDWWKNVDWRKANAYLGGEPAAATLTRYLKPERVAIYVAGEVNKFLLKNRLVKDAAGNVEICKAFWRFNYHWEYPELVPPLLIYADLLATADARNIETGKIIYDQHLARLVEQD